MCPGRTSESGEEWKAILFINKTAVCFEEQVRQTFPLCSHLSRNLKLMPVMTMHPAIIPSAGRASGHIFRDFAAASALLHSARELSLSEHYLEIKTELGEKLWSWIR